MDSSGYLLRVSRVIRETADACSLVLEVPEALAPQFRYRAGQFVTLRIPFAGLELSRSYSLASSPDVDGEMKITVKRVPEGRVSNWLNDNLKAGDTVRVMPPGGTFVLEESARPLAFLAGGSGITPVFSLMKSALACTSRKVSLLYANRDPDSVIFKQELETVTARYPDRVRVRHHFDVEKGFLDKETVAARVRETPEAEFYVCGPAGFMDVVLAALADLGVPQMQIRTERFVSPPDPIMEDTGADSVSGVPCRVSVYLDGRRHQVLCRPGQTVLSAVQEAGLEPPFSCTDGFCGCCMARLRAGKVRMIKNDFLSQRELQEGWVLTCQSLPEADGCEIHYPD